MLAAAPSVHAVSLYWDTNGTGTVGSGAATGTWGTDVFWTTDPTGANVGSPVLTAATTNADDLFFSAGTNGTTGIVTINTTQSAHSITLDDAVAITLSGGTAINLGSATAGSGLFFTGNAANVISTPIILNSAATAIAISNSTASLQTIGAITGSASSGTQTITVGSSSSGGITLNGIIGDGAGPGNVALTINNTSSGVTTLTGANGYTGATTLNGGTLNLSGAAGSIAASTGITLNGGGLQLTNASTEGALDRVASVPITSNGGTITYANTATGTAYAEVLGTLALTKGQLNVVSTNAVTSGTETLTFGAGSLTHAAANTSAITFSGGSLGASAKNSIIIDSQATTGVGTIIGPWATFGTTAALQTDYATYNITNGATNAFGIQNANIAATTDVNWTDSTKAYTNGTGGALALGAAAHNMLGLRNTGATTVMTIPTGGNLNTYGLLNGVGTLWTVAATGTGALSTPTGGGNLYVTTGSGAITVSAPIADNAGPVTLVAGGAGTLTLSGTNTYTGGTVVNAGTLVASADTNLGAASGGMTFNGTCTFGNDGSWTIGSGRTITVSAGANVTFNFGAGVFAGPVVGSGTFTVSKPSQGNPGLSLTNTSNTFTGAMNLIDKGSSGYASYTFSSLGDAPGAGIISLGYGGGQGAYFIWGSGAIAPLVLNYRQFDFGGSPGSFITNNNTASSSANTITVNTDLLVTGTGSRTLTLGGTNTGANTFAGKIPDGPSGTVISLTKADAGTWVLSGSNTYTGGTTVSAGKLIMTKPASLGNGALNIGANTFIYAPTAAGALNIGSGVLTKTGGAIGTAVGGSLSQSAITSTGAAALSGTGTVNVYGISGVSPTAGTNNLITAASGLSAGTYTLGTVFNNTDFTVSNFTRATGTAISVDVTAQAALSGNVFWKGGLAGNTGVWAASNGAQTQSNWEVTDGTAQPLAPGATADLVFSTATSPGTMVGMTLGANMTVRTVTVNNTATAFGLGADGFTLTLTPASSTDGITINAGVLAGTIGANVALGAAQTWTNNSANTLTVSGSISGANNLTKAGTGMVTLSGANGYSGATTVNAGILNFANTGAKSSATTVTTLAAGSIGLGVGSASPYYSDADVAALFNTNTLSGFNLVAGSGVALDTTAGNFTQSTALTAARALTKLGANTLTLTGANTYSGSTTIAAGTLNANSSAALGDETQATNTLIFSGGALQAGGTITSASSRGVTLNSTGTIDTNNNAVSIAGVISGTGGLTKNGLGTLTLSGANNYNGGTTVNAGTLLLSGAVNMPATGTLAVNAGSTFSLADGTAQATNGATTGVGLNLATGSYLAFDWNGGSLDSFTTTGTATTAGTVGIIINNTSPSGGGGTLITAASGLSTANYFLANNTNFAATLSKTDTTVSIGAQSSVAALTDAYWLGNKVTGATGAMALSNGTSNWASAADGTLAGGVVPSGSAVNVIFSATGGALQPTVTTGADMNLGSITFNDTAAVTIAGSNTITLNSTSGTAATTTAALATVTAGSAISVTSFANATNTISAKIALGANQTWNVASGKNLAVSGVVSGAFALTKADAGKLTLSGPNTFTGQLAVQDGTLAIGTINNASADGTLGSSALSVILGNTGAQTGTLQYTGATASSTKKFTLATGGTGAFDVTTGATNLTLSGVIDGSGTMTKSGAGTLTLDGTNSYSGGTIISAGQVSISSVGNLGGPGRNVTFTGTATLSPSNASYTGANALGTLTIGSGATANIIPSTGNHMTFATLTGAGTLHWGRGNGGSTFTITDASAFTGELRVSPGSSSAPTISVGGLTDTGTPGVGNLQYGVGTIQHYSTIEFSTLPGPLTLFNRRVEILAGSNVLTAFLNNNAANNVIIKQDLVNASSGAKPFQLGGSNTGANEFAGVISNGTGGGTISFVNAGTWILSGANTYTGKTTISAGTLSINSIQNASSVTGNSLGTPGVGANSIIDIASTGTLRYIGTGHSSDRVINLTTAAGGTFTLDASGPSGTFALTGGVTNAGSSGTSTVALTGTGLGSQSGSIVNGTSTNVAAVTKSGAGTWTLSGANTYTGATTVSGGKLLLGQGGSMGASAVSVTGTGTYGTAYTSSGNSIAGGKSLSLASGTTLNMKDGYTNTLSFTTTGALNGAGLWFDLGATTADQVQIMGATTVTGANTFYFTVPGGLATGTHAYTLIGAGGGLSGAGTFVIDPALTLTDYTLALDRDGTGVYLNVTANRIPGDADNNKVVDAADYITLKQNFGMTSGALWKDGNFSDTYGTPGTVDWADLQILMAHFGAGSLSAPAMNTPEPATLGLLAIGALAILRRRRK